MSVGDSVSLFGGKLGDKADSQTAVTSRGTEVAGAHSPTELGGGEGLGSPPPVGAGRVLVPRFPGLLPPSPRGGNTGSGHGTGLEADGTWLT